MCVTAEIIGAMEIVKNFLANDKFLYPFSSTLGATVTVLLFQFVQRFVSERKKKIFAISYIYDVCSRIFESNLILKNHTIIPHIEAIERIFQGETELLKTMFETGDFQILTDKRIDFKLLPEEHQVLVGCDNIKLIQAFEALKYLYEQDSKAKILNDHVSQNLSSELEFLKLVGTEQSEILETYLGNLDSVTHENDRVLWFVIFVMLPTLKKYSDSLQFIGFSKKSIKSTQEIIDSKTEEYKELLPAKDFMMQKKNSGIQSSL